MHQRPHSTLPLRSVSGGPIFTPHPTLTSTFTISLPLLKLTGINALIICCRDGYELCAQTLLEAGACKDLKMDDGATALSLARSKGHLEVRWLLEK